MIRSLEDSLRRTFLVIAFSVIAFPVIAFPVIAFPVIAFSVIVGACALPVKCPAGMPRNPVA
jgi:hypothetical protein